MKVVSTIINPLFSSRGNSQSENANRSNSSDPANQTIVGLIRSQLDSYENTRDTVNLNKAGQQNTQTVLIKSQAQTSTIETGGLFDRAASPQKVSTLLKKVASVYQQMRQNQPQAPAEMEEAAPETPPENAGNVPAERTNRTGSIKNPIKNLLRSNPGFVFPEVLQKEDIGAQLDIMINYEIANLQQTLAEDETTDNPIQKFQDKYLSSNKLNPIQEFRNKFITKTDIMNPLKEYQTKLTETETLNGLEEFRDKFINKSTIVKPFEEYQDKFINSISLNPPMKDYQDEFVEKIKDMNPLQEFRDRFIEKSTFPNPLKELQDKFIPNTSTLNPLKEFQDTFIRTA